MTNRRRRRARHKAHKAKARRGRELLDVLRAFFDLQHEFHSVTERRILLAAQYLNAHKP